MAVNDFVKWKTYKQGSDYSKQWHYGYVVAEATDQDEDGPYCDIEYSHSVPASNQKSGRVVRVFGVHKVQVIGKGSSNGASNH